MLKSYGWSGCVIQVIIVSAPVKRIGGLGGFQTLSELIGSGLGTRWDEDWDWYFTIVLW